MKKLQNSFNVFLPQNYGDFSRAIDTLNSNAAVVAELLRICCEEDNPKAIELAFERIIGKPEQVVIIKRTLVRTVFPDAKTKHQLPPVSNRVEDEVQSVGSQDDVVVISETEAPGYLLKKELEAIGEKPRAYAYDVTDKRNKYTVAQVMVANLYSMAMAGGSLKAIDIIFKYLDGTVADVIKLEGEDTVLLESWADIAPYDAVQDENGVWYVETAAVS